MPDPYNLNKPTAAPKADYHSYQDATGEFNANRLQFGLWFVQNKVLLYRILLFAIGVFGGVLWVYSLVQWTKYFVGYSAQLRLDATLATANNYQAINQRLSPMPLQVEYNSLLVGGVKKMDAVARVINPNRNFIAKIKYNFLIGGQVTSSSEAVILPGESTFATTMGLSMESGIVGNDVLFQIEKPSWERVPPHKINDPIAYRDERLRFEPDKFVYSPASSDLPSNRLVFNLVNNSAYGYRSPEFYLAMYSNNSLIGMMRFKTDDFKAQETKEIDLRNFVPNLMVQKIEVYPLINVYDNSVYLSPEKK